MTKCRTLGPLVDRFLSGMQCADSTRALYANYLRPFRSDFGELRIDDLTSSSVHGWIHKVYKNHSASSQNSAARSVTRMLNWAIEERIIDRSPLRHFRKPSASAREVIVTQEEYARCVRLAENPLRDIVKFLWHCGARPQELRIIEKKWISDGRIVFPQSLSKGKRKRRVIYLDSMSGRIAERLAMAHPRGAIFRNTRHQPWTKDALGNAFRKLGEKAEVPGLCAYALRHAWITALLKKGVDAASVAALAGNSPRLVLDTYNHVHAGDARLRRLVG